MLRSCMKWVLIPYLLSSMDGLASSRVIRDNRLSDLAVTPNLGRGYSIATNTFQSLCFSEIETTTPSYNMRYRFVDIERDWEQSFEGKFDTESNFQFLFLKSNINTHTEVINNTTLHHHYIFAFISVDSYYNAINEGMSTFSASAKGLLERGDVVGFFDSCGGYYVRSIGRHSSFLGLLRYTTLSTERDISFELELKAKLRGIFSGGSAETDISNRFRRETQDKRLTINIWAYGLGKDHLADLIPTDIDSFKKTVSESIKAMQDASTGIVTTMEVTPWVENTEFQDLLTLETEEDRLLFEEKKNLEANSELIAEIDRVDRAQIDQYFKARNCRRILDEEYLSIVDEEFGYDPDHTWFHDLAAKGQINKQVNLNYLSTILSNENVENYSLSNDTFLYGEDPDDPETGAISCLEQLHAGGLRSVHYRSIPACINARATSVPLAPILDHYCMPELARITSPEPTPSDM